MTELLYNKSKAVAALNKVEGFNALEFARRISNEGEAEQLYLDVKYRKLWFRLLNPTGKIISNIISLTENMAVVEARVYLDMMPEVLPAGGGNPWHRLQLLNGKRQPGKDMRHRVLLLNDAP